MAYEHRNGDFSPPTVEGWFRFTGRYKGKFVGWLVQVRWPTGGHPKLVASPLGTADEYRLDDFHGLWAGPLPTDEFGPEQMANWEKGG